MFRSLIFVLMVGIVAVLAVELYSDKFDHVDVDAILADDAKRLEYYNCFMDTGPCHGEDAQYFKDNLPEAVVTKCLRCTEKQKQMVEKIVIWYVKNAEAEWNTLIAKLLEDAKRLKIAGVY